MNPIPNQAKKKNQTTNKKIIFALGFPRDKMIIRHRFSRCTIQKNFTVKNPHHD